MTGLTQKRNLRTGRPLWADSPFTGVAVHPLREAVSVDVAIVGAGVSGAFMAHELSRDMSVAVLDRRPPMTGSTMASTALLQWEIDLPLTALSKAIGPDKARRAYRRCRRALDDLKTIVEEERIRCGLRARDTLYLAGDAYGCRALSDEAEARQAIGLESRFIKGGDLRDRYGIDRTGAIVSKGSASADPARLTAGLLRRAAARGARIYSPVEVIEAVSDPDGVTLLTDGGVAVRAARVVFCCGYERPQGVEMSDAVVKSTWAFASKPGARFPAWLKGTMIWEASDPYIYLRTTNDGRLIGGGEDQDGPADHADRALMKRKGDRILRKVQALLPSVDIDVDYLWGGSFGESASGLPIIAPIRTTPHAWAVMGFGGNGVTYSVIASQVVSAALRGGADPDADLYLP